MNLYMNTHSQLFHRKYDQIDVNFERINTSKIIRNKLTVLDKPAE